MLLSKGRNSKISKGDVLNNNIEYEIYGMDRMVDD